MRPAAHPGGEEVEVELCACKDTAPKQSQSCTSSKPCRKRSVTNTQSDVLDGGSDADSGSLQTLEDKDMARYSKKPNAAPGDDRSKRRNVASDFEYLVDDQVSPSDDADLEDQKSFPNAAEKDSSSLKPGSVVEDVVRPDSIVLMEAPYIPIRSNFSDQAFQEDGEVIDMELETDKMKTYTGAEAVKRMHSSEDGNIESSPNSNRTS